MVPKEENIYSHYGGNHQYDVYDLDYSSMHRELPSALTPRVLTFSSLVLAITALYAQKVKTIKLKRYFRVPVYIASREAALEHLIPEIAIMSVGVIIGTLLGAPLLRHLPERYFKATLSVILIVVGVLVAIRI